MADRLHFSTAIVAITITITIIVSIIATALI
jgi:hypothetical protein